MTLKTILIFVGLATVVTAFLQPSTPTISIMQPQGIKFIIPDQAGTTLIAVHYSVNSPLQGTAGGQYNYDIHTKTNGQWIHENPGVVVNPGDTVNYWLYQIINGQPHQVLNQVWTAGVTTTTKAPTTTARPTPKPSTTKQTPRPTTHAPLVSSQSNNNQMNNNNNHQSNNHVAGNRFNNNMTSSTAITSGSQTMTSGSQTAGNGTCCACSCSSSSQSPAPSGSNVSPAGSGPTGSQCTSYPCLIFEDEFDSLNLDVWEHEITAGGGGNWEFQYYTNNRTNSYVRDGKLFIKPTLTIDALNDGPNSLTKGALDLWGSQPGDVCTGNAFWGCRREGNPTNIINPVQSARLRSSRGFSFKYGKVEVEAKMPKGDWLWPAIWMLPLRNAYGKWPASGEIDIVEARGNRQYTDNNGKEQGVKNAGSTLHFGSDFWHNKWPKAHGEKLASSGSYGDSFHKYVLIWDENHISISIDGSEVLNVTPTNTMWEYGGLDQDGNIDNPWRAGTKMAPFDQEFFLILNVAVGGTAFFPDHNHNPTGKPWSDASQTAPRDFWNAHATWYPTWHPTTNNGEDAAMQIKYIRVYKLKP